MDYYTLKKLSNKSTRIRGWIHYNRVVQKHENSRILLWFLNIFGFSLNSYSILPSFSDKEEEELLQTNIEKNTMRQHEQLEFQLSQI